MLAVAMDMAVVQLERVDLMKEKVNQELLLVEEVFAPE